MENRSDGNERLLTRCALLICSKLSKNLEGGWRASLRLYEIIDFPAMLLCENYALKLVTVHYRVRTVPVQRERKNVWNCDFFDTYLAISVCDDDIMLIVSELNNRNAQCAVYVSTHRLLLRRKIVDCTLLVTCHIRFISDQFTFVLVKMRRRNIFYGKFRKMSRLRQLTTIPSILSIVIHGEPGQNDILIQTCEAFNRILHRNLR